MLLYAGIVCSIATLGKDVIDARDKVMVGTVYIYIYSSNVLATFTITSHNSAFENFHFSLVVVFLVSSLFISLWLSSVSTLCLPVKKAYYHIKMGCIMKRKTQKERASRRAIICAPKHTTNKRKMNKNNNTLRVKKRRTCRDEDDVKKLNGRAEQQKNNERRKTYKNLCSVCVCDSGTLLARA